MKHIYILLVLFSISVTSESSDDIGKSQKIISYNSALKTEKETAAKKTSVQNSESVPENVNQNNVKESFDFNRLNNSYRLQKVEAVDYSGKHTINEMNNFRQEAQREYDSKDRAVDWYNGRMYLISKNDASRYGYFDFTVKDNFIISKTCKDCQDNRYEIIAQTDSALVLQIQPQDQGQFFVYQFFFKK